MTVSRRRFLTLSAAFACAPAVARAHTWTGHAFGAEICITLHGPRSETDPALHAARRAIREIEGLLSLYDFGSDLSRLNASGHLSHPNPHLLAVMRASDELHRATGGLFDPSVQPLWRAMAQGTDTMRARNLVDWTRVRFGPEAITLAPGQALTFNGIAQGYATDVVTQALRDRGLRNILVNIGEFLTDSGPWRIALSDPAAGRLGHRTLQTGAIASSSPGAMQVGATGHILHPNALPVWSTVSVEAGTATLADGLSTALVVSPKAQIARLKPMFATVTRITLIDSKGDMSSL